MKPKRRRLEKRLKFWPACVWGIAKIMLQSGSDTDRDNVSSISTKQKLLVSLGGSVPAPALPTLYGCDMYGVHGVRHYSKPRSGNDQQAHDAETGPGCETHVELRAAVWCNNGFRRYRRLYRRPLQFSYL